MNLSEVICAYTYSFNRNYSRSKECNACVATGFTNNHVTCIKKLSTTRLSVQLFTYLLVVYIFKIYTNKHLTCSCVQIVGFTDIKDLS